MITDIAIFSKANVQYNSEKKQYLIPLYDVDNRYFWFTADFDERLYQVAVLGIDNQSRHLFFSGNLVDSIIMQDFLGPIPEARQRIHILFMKVMKSSIMSPA